MTGSPPIKVKKMSYATYVHVVDGVPQCNCCHEPMVEVEPNGWMCAVGAAATSLLARYSSMLNDITFHGEHP